mgnify:CR=1 FL=1
MPLNFVNIRPGFNKQITPTAAEGQYIMLDLDMVYLKKLVVGNSLLEKL